MNDFVVDAFEFCRLSESRKGEVQLAALLRLASESLDKSGLVRWSLQGATNRLGYPQLTLLISGDVRLMCQRCLAPFVFNVESQSTLVLAPDEGGGR